MKVKGNLQVSGTLEGITFTDGSTTYSRKHKLTFAAGDFYLAGDGLGGPKVLLKNPPSIRFSDGSNNYATATYLGVSNSTFYLSRGSLGQPVLNVKNGILKSIVLENAGAAENVLVFYAPRAMRILSARGVCVGSSPSVTLSVKSGTDRSSLGTTNTTSTAVTSTTTGTDLPVSTAAIAAGSWVCVVSTAQSGTVTQLEVSLEVEFV